MFLIYSSGWIQIADHCRSNLTYISIFQNLLLVICSGGSKGARIPRAPGVQILSISCSFWEILAK